MTIMPHPLRYITILVEMTKFEGTKHGKLIADQMLNVAIRVKDVRPFAVRQMVSQLTFKSRYLLINPHGVCEYLAILLTSVLLNFCLTYIVHHIGEHSSLHWHHSKPWHL